MKQQLQTQALVEEKILIEEKEKEKARKMETAVQFMKAKEKEKEFKAAKERGEAFAPDGRPIPENQNNGIRPLDPRTPKTFGNPFARVNDVEESVVKKVAKAGLSKKDLDAMLNATALTDDVSDYMMFLNIKPRHMCGIDLDHAEQWCGPTCDPALEFCIMGHIDDVPGYVNFMNQDTGMYENWGRCFPDVQCLDPNGHELILDDPDGCAPKVVNNPCPNPCDCLGKRKDINECHSFCALSDSFSLLNCFILREKGKTKRELKVAEALGNLAACDYNVFYEHPLMHSELLEKERLPGLFGTF